MSSSRISVPDGSIALILPVETAQLLQSFLLATANAVRAANISNGTIKMPVFTMSEYRAIQDTIIINGAAIQVRS